MAKIIVYAGAKNDGDIIESFVRHTLTFADELVIHDHKSSDGTREILAALQAEGLPICVRDAMEGQMEDALGLSPLREAIEERGADIVLPLDADEFVANFVTTETVRECLEQLDRNAFYLLRWYRFEPLYPDLNNDNFLLARPAKKAKDFSRSYKSLVYVDYYKARPFQLTQGNHFAYWLKEDGEREEVPFIYSPKLSIAYYHWRSKEQYKGKNVTGWPEIVMYHSKHTPVGDKWREAFLRTAAGELYEKEESFEGAETEEWNWNGRMKFPIDKLKYSHLFRYDPLRNVMMSALEIAQVCAEQKTLLKGIVAAYIVIWFGGTKKLRQTLLSIMRSSYNKREIIVINPRDDAPSAIPPLGWLSLPPDTKYLTGSLSETLAGLKGRVRGDYVQLIIAGEELKLEKTGYELSALENFTYMRLEGMISAGAEKAEKEIGLFCDSDSLSNTAVSHYKTDYLWDFFLEKGYPFYGGLTAAVFRRDVAEKVDYFANCWLDDRLLELSAWKAVFDLGGQYAVMSENMVRRNLTAKETLENLIWFQLERREYLRQATESATASDDKERQAKIATGIANCAEQAENVAHLAELNSVDATLVKACRGQA